MGDEQPQQRQEARRPGSPFSSSVVEAHPSSSRRVTVPPDAADGGTNLQSRPQNFESYVQHFVNDDTAAASASFVVRNPPDPTITTMTASVSTPTTSVIAAAAAAAESASAEVSPPQRRQQQQTETPGQPEQQMSIRPRQEQPLSQPAPHHTRDQTGCTDVSALTDLDDLDIEGEINDDDNDAIPYPSTPANRQSSERRSSQTTAVVDIEGMNSNVRARRSPSGRPNPLSPVNEVPSPSTVDQKWNYHLDDVIKSTREGPDESAVMKTVEKTTKHVSKRSLLPEVSDMFVFNQLDNLHQRGENDYEDSFLPQHHLNHRNRHHHQNYPSLRSHDGLSDVTRKLQKAPMWRTASDGTTKGSKRDNESSDNNDNINSSLILSKKLEEYCENAARVMPSRRTMVRQSSSSQELHHDHSDHTNNSNDNTKKQNNNNKNDLENQSEFHTENEQSQSSSKETRVGLHSIFRYGRRAKADVDFFLDFMEPYKKSGFQILLKVVLYILLPCLIIAAILFYLGDNPPTGTALYTCNDTSTGRFAITPTITRNTTNATDDTEAVSRSDLDEGEELCIDEAKSLADASISWWLIFASRQVIMLCTSFSLQVLIIDFFTLRTRFLPSLVGTHFSLTIAASKGFPFILFMWTILDFIFLFGNNRLARHWLYWQKYVTLFNAANPSGNVTDNWFYRNILYLGVGGSIAATIKRAAMANVVGKRVVVSYRKELTRVIKQNVLLGEVATLSAISRRSHRSTVMRKYDNVKNMYVQRLNTIHDEDNDTAASPADAFLDAQKPTAGTDSHINKRSSVNVTSSLFHEGVGEFLDEWEEPELQELQESDQHAPTTTDVLLFRRALDFIDTEYPFSSSFGKADTREHCIESAQNVFDQLRAGRRYVVDFSVLKQVAVTENGMDKEKLRQLVKMFRPNRIGEISKLDFVKSCDKVYKSYRLLLANINSSSQIDRAYERIVNIAFYFIFVITALGVLGVDLNNLFLLLSSLLVSCAFMIQSASSKYIEGILLVLSRKPYDVGDRIAIMEPNAAVDNNGPPSGGWVVEKVDLFTTQVRLGTTREYCTFANGSLANSRILNMNRSPSPNVFHYLKFNLSVTQDQLDAFKNDVTEYVKDRPRSWKKIVSMRCDSIAVDQNYIQYILIIQHREKWQAFGQIVSDRGQVFIFCLHLMKKLGMNYEAPKMPIELVPGQRRSPPDSSSAVAAAAGTAGVDDDVIQLITETYGPNGIDPISNPEEGKNKDV